MLFSSAWRLHSSCKTCSKWIPNTYYLLQRIWTYLQVRINMSARSFHDRPSVLCCRRDIRQREVDRRNWKSLSAFSRTLHCPFVLGCWLPPIKSPRLVLVSVFFMPLFTPVCSLFVFASLAFPFLSFVEESFLQFLLPPRSRVTFPSPPAIVRQTTDINKWTHTTNAWSMLYRVR